ncbi:peptidase C26 [Bifidobacterium gallicum DSM 20093 = LMG 11596]|nr:peptidase C26 [Bifidobacterium gallicum DSM 20093 = LMG 11596]
MWMLPEYFTMLERSGAVPMMLPMSTDQTVIAQCIELCDGVLFTGGIDIHPSEYGQDPSSQCGETSRELDAVERLCMQYCLDNDVPLLGICRGLQFLNVMLGGTLYQDLPTERPSHVNHNMRVAYDRPVHDVTIEHGTPLAEILADVHSIGVNSRHHQAVKTVGQGALVNAVSEDGLVEAISVPGKTFALAVQWHPESMFALDERNRRIVAAFVAAMRSTMTEAA